MSARMEIFDKIVAAIKAKTSVFIVCNQSGEITKEDLPAIHIFIVSDRKPLSNQLLESRELDFSIEIYAVGKDKMKLLDEIETAINEALVTGNAKQFGCTSLKGGDADFINDESWYENCQMTLNYTATYTTPSPLAKRK